MMYERNRISINIWYQITCSPDKVTYDKDIESKNYLDN